MKKKEKCVLPSYKKLMDVGLSGLCIAKGKHPEKFSHIKQEKLIRTIEENVRLAEELSKNNKNILPNRVWLRENGYGILVSAISRCPEKFDHIKQEKLLKTVDEHVKIAEELAKNNKGILHPQSWLQNNGYGGLSSMMSKYPDKFSHIKQEKLTRTIKENVRLAEDLAKKNNGILYSKKWLRENGYDGLYVCIAKYPNKFSHIEQEKLIKTIDQYVKIAEDLAKKNNGILPGGGWLVKHKYSGIFKYLKKYPEKFSHIKQNYKGGNTIEKNIKIAEDLAKNNNGLLPNCTWLSKNRYLCVYKSLLKYPEKFAHIKQEKLFKTVDEQIRIAEKLAKRNKEILPNTYWLIKNGYKALAQSMYKHPEKFAHVKQKKIKKTVKEHIKKYKELIKNNNGVHYSVYWLQNNGYYGLAGCIKKHPEKFKNIK